MKKACNLASQGPRPTGPKISVHMTQLLAQTRMKTFDIPHKGLRNMLAQVTMLAGTTDFTNKAQVAHLHQLGRDLFQLLTEHARDENEIVLAALDQRQPGAGMHNEAEHEIIEEQQAKLEEMLETLVAKAKKGDEVHHLAERFYFEMNRFQSGYLLHMLEEEEETQRLLWKYFSDAELLEMRKQIIARMSPASQLQWYRFAAPYMSHAGRFQWLKAVKTVAPPPFFLQIMETLEMVLPSGDFRRLQGELG